MNISVLGCGRWGSFLAWYTNRIGHEATLFSPHSHNRKFGEDFVRGIQFSKLAEGVATLEALQKLAHQYNVELPICNALYQIIIKGESPSEALIDLFMRPIKFEF